MDSDLTGPMKEALTRMAKNMVWADGRSVKALIRRGLVERRGKINDAMLGSFHIDIITQNGREEAERLGIRNFKLGELE